MILNQKRATFIQKGLFPKIVDAKIKPSVDKDTDKCYYKSAVKSPNAVAFVNLPKTISQATVLSFLNRFS